VSKITTTTIIADFQDTLDPLRWKVVSHSHRDGAGWGHNPHDQWLNHCVGLTGQEALDFMYSNWAQYKNQGRHEVRQCGNVAYVELDSEPCPRLGFRLVLQRPQ